MSETRDDGGPAFPGSTSGDTGDGMSYVLRIPGMSLRDYFAAKAMQGELAADESTGFYTGDEGAVALAKRAYEIADAMLKARKA